VKHASRVLSRYNGDSRLAQVILPSGRTHGFMHDNNRNRTQITMPSGTVLGLGYNKINLDNSYVPPNNPAYGSKQLFLVLRHFS
jgi:YD repeat-containing protein